MNAVIRKYDPIMKQAIGSMQNDTENAAADTINIGIKYAIKRQPKKRVF